MTALASYAAPQARAFMQRRTPVMHGASWSQFIRQSQSLGWDQGFVEMLMASAVPQDSPDGYWAYFMDAYLDITDMQPHFAQRYRHIAVAGETASGKSTLLAQIACTLAQQNGEEALTLILCENASGAVNELLLCLARILDCKLVYVRHPQELQYELETMGRYRRFLIDLPSKPAEQLPYLEYIKAMPTLSHLGILCMLARRSDALASKAAMEIWLKYSHAWALSFAAEHAPIGPALSMASKSPRPLAYVSKSHDMLEGLEPASVQCLKALMMSAITRLNHGQDYKIMVS